MSLFVYYRLIVQNSCCQTFAICDLGQPLHRARQVTCPGTSFVKNICRTLKAASKRMKRGDVVWRMKRPVLALTWMDKKAVHATGTYTQAPTEHIPEVNRKQRDGTIEKILCPELISSYNTYMGGVDKNDQMKSYYPIPVA